jgi:hypothetical protein
MMAFPHVNVPGDPGFSVSMAWVAAEAPPVRQHQPSFGSLFTEKRKMHVKHVRRKDDGCLQAARLQVSAEPSTPL